MSKLHKFLATKYLKSWLCDSIIVGVKNKTVTGRNAFGEPIYTEKYNPLAVRITKEYSKEIKDGLEKYIILEYVNYDGTSLSVTDSIEIKGYEYDVIATSEKITLSNNNIIFEVTLIRKLN